MGGGVSTLIRAVSGGKQNSSGNREACEIFRETRSNEVKISGIFPRNFGEYLPKIRDDFPDFQEDFCLHMVLFKERLLELSHLPHPLPPVRSGCK